MRLRLNDDFSNIICTNRIYIFLLIIRVIWTDSIPVDIHNNTVYVTPPPSNGAIVAFILNILKGYNFTADSISTPDKEILTLHRITEAFKFGMF